MRSLVLVLFFALGCTKTNPNVCCTDEADCNAKGIPVGSVCEAGLICRGNQCISEPCADSSKCDAAAPYCVADLCSESCNDDVQCPGFGQDLTDRFCVNGSCVACRDSSDCPTSAPVCDNNTCRGCNADGDCASGVCDVDTATCIAESAVLYVSGNGSPTTDCTRAAPCTIQHAFTLITANRNAIKLGTNSHAMGGLGPTGPVSVTIYGPGTLMGDGGASDGATLRVRDVVWNGAAGCGNSTVNLPLSTLDLERVQAYFGISQSSICNITIRDSRIHSTATGPASLYYLAGESTQSGAAMNRMASLKIDRTIIEGGDPAIQLGFLADLQVTNSVFLNQGTQVGWIVAADNSSATSTVRFSTFYNSVLRCGTVAGTGFVAYSNNIFINGRSGAPADTVSGTFCSHSYDLMRPQTTAVPGPGNKLGVDPMFVDTNATDLHLRATSPAIDAADPAATETTDFDGVSRPQGAGRDIGAYEYKP